MVSLHLPSQGESDLASLRFAELRFPSEEVVQSPRQQSQRGGSLLGVLVLLGLVVGLTDLFGLIPVPAGSSLAFFGLAPLADSTRRSLHLPILCPREIVKLVLPQQHAHIFLASLQGVLRGGRAVHTLLGTLLRCFSRLPVLLLWLCILLGRIEGVRVFL